MKPLMKINAFHQASNFSISKLLPMLSVKDQKNHSPKWALTLKQLCLKEQMEARYPFMFDPSHHISLLIIAWDYGKIWEVLPDQDSLYVEHFKIPIARKNTRKLKGKDISLFSGQKIKGSINLLFYIAGMDDLCDGLNLKQYVEESILCDQIKELKGKPALTPSINLKGAVESTTKMMSKFAQLGQMTLLPLLEATYDASQITDTSTIKIEEESFEVILEFLRY